MPTTSLAYAGPTTFLGEACDSTWGRSGCARDCVEMKVTYQSGDSGHRCAPLDPRCVGKSGDIELPTRTLLVADRYMAARLAKEDPVNPLLRGGRVEGHGGRRHTLQQH